MQEIVDSPVADLKEVFRSITENAGAQTVYGEPITVGDKTILPVARILYGFGGGSGDSSSHPSRGGGGGGGCIAKPLGVVEITPSRTRFIPIGTNGRVLFALGLGIVLGVRLMWKKR